MRAETAFSGSYVEARERFRERAAAAGAMLSTYLLGDVRGAQGEDLSVDVAVLGDAGAGKALLSISGTHGLEAAAGSAAQLAFLESLAQDTTPAGIKLVFVHSLNPYGHSHG